MNLKLFRTLALGFLLCFMANVTFGQCWQYFQYAGNGCTGTFQVSEVDPSATYSWVFESLNTNDVVTATGPNPSVDFPLVPNGVWEATLTITSPNGNDSCTQNVYMSCYSGGQCGETGWGYETDECIAGFIAPTYESITNYEWDFGDGYTISGGPANANIPNGTNDGNTWSEYDEPRHNFPGNGTYIVTLIITFQSGHQTICQGEVIIDNCVPTGCEGCEFTAAPQVECAQLITMLAPECHNEGDTHQWFFNGQSIGETFNDTPFGHQVQYINTQLNPTGLYQHSVNNGPLCDVTVTWPQAGIFIGQQCGTDNLTNMIAMGILPANGNTINVPVFINSTLTVDVSYVFNNANIFMGMGAGIDVVQSPNSFFTFFQVLNGTSITAQAECPCMWRGINVFRGGFLFTNGQQRNLISDALYATRAVNLGNGNFNPILSMRATDFIDNFVGTRATDGQFFHFLSDLTYAGGNSLNVSCGACPTVNDLEAQFPYMQQNSFAGILIDGVSGQNGATLTINANSQENQFRNLACGILINDANATINSCSFTNMERFGYTEDAGFGIRYIDGVLGGTTFLQDGTGSSFNQCETAIYAGTHTFGTTVDVQNNSMSNVQNGITLISPNNPDNNTVGNITSGTVSGNVINSDMNFGFTTTGHGIMVADRNNANSTFEIDGNTINVDQPNSVGIWSLGLMPGTGTNLTTTSNVDNNVITMDDGTDGYRVVNLADNNLFGNHIILNQPNFGSGMRITNSGRSDFFCNTIEDENTGFTWAIQAIGSESNRYGGNEIWDTNHGLRSFADNSNSFFFLNQFSGNINQSVAFFGSTSFGIQNNQFNRWVGNQNVNWSGAPSQNWIFQNRWIVNPNNGFAPSGNINPAFWYPMNGNVGFDVNCAPGTITMLSEEEVTAKDYAIANGDYDNMDAGTVWSLKRGLYNKLKSNPDFLSDAAMSQYLSTQSGEAVGEYYEVGVIMDEVFDVDAGLQNAFNKAQAAIQQSMAGINKLSPALASGPDVDEAVLADLKALNADLQALLAQQSEITAAITAKQSAKAQDALSVNNSLNAQNDAQSKLQFLNTLYLERAAGNNWKFTPAEKNEILAIASACPDDLGSAVYFAIGFHAQITGEYLEVQTCTVTQQNKVQSPTVFTESKLNLYPNPSNGAVDYMISNIDLEKELTLQVKDVLGKIIYTRTLAADENKGNLSLDRLSSGVYIVTIYADNEIVTSDKLIIEK